MKRNSLPFITVILFFICIALLFVYLLGLRLYSPLPTAVFWVLVITAISVIVFQIVKIPWPGYEPLLVVEILILGFTLHMTHLIPFYVLPNTDSLRALVIAEQISEHGTILAIMPGVSGTASWPLLMVWGVELHHLTGITLSSIVKWLPPIFTSSLFVLLLYALTKRVYKSEKVALLTILLMVTLHYFTYEGTVFKQEVLALVIMMAGLYLLTMTQGSNRVKFIILSLLCLSGVIFAHHLTSLVFLAVLVVFLITTRILNSLSGNWLPSLKKETLIITGIFTILAFVATFSYWTYIAAEPLEALVSAGRTILYGEPGMTLAETSYVVNPQDIMEVRGRITFWGYYLFHAAFAIFLLRGFFSRAKEKHPEFYSFTILLFIYGAWSLLQLYILPKTTPGVMSTERWLMLGWIWGFAPLAFCVLESKWRWSKQLGIIILVAFMIFNMYMLAPVKWDFQAAGRAEGHVVLKEDYALAETLPLTGEGATYKATRIAIYDVQRYYALPLSKINPDQLETLDWLAIKKKQLEGYIKSSKIFEEAGRYFMRGESEVLNELGELLTEGSSGGRDRIYDSNNLVVFK